MAEKTRTLVSGFLAFEGFEINPSALLAQGCGRPFELIEVSYTAVDMFVNSLDASRFDRLLMIGVAGKSSRMRFERSGKNVIGARPDVRGAADAGVIDATGPMSLSGSLWTHPTFAVDTDRCRPSDDAGDYLCNYIYYRALQRFDASKKQIGFLHVPPLEKMALEEQQRELARVLTIIES